MQKTALISSCALVLFSSTITLASSAKPEVDSFYGAWTTAVPLEVPEFRGIQPALSLVYRSGGANGVVGMGWDLTGFSTISVSLPDLALGKTVYFLDGQELVPCLSGSVSPSCTTGGNYAAKIESYMRIRFDATTQQWTVWQGNGTRTIYGSLQKNSQGTIIRWGVTQVIDTLGNSVVYSWNCPAGDGVGRCYPWSISYNPQHLTTVIFYYETRPDNVLYQNFEGTGILKQRLRTVDVVVDNSRVRAYALAYKTSTATGRSLLQSVRQYGTDTALNADGSIYRGSSLPPVTFEYKDTADFVRWQEASAQYSPPDVFLYQGEPYGTPNTIWDTGMRTVDFDGDGRVDLLRNGLASTRNMLWFNRGTDSSTSSVWSQTAAPVDAAGAALWSFVGDEQYEGSEMADLNGDGLLDVVFESSDQGSKGAWLNTGAGSWVRDDTYVSWLWNTVAHLKWGYFVDLNGDGRSDFLYSKLVSTSTTPFNLVHVLDALLNVPSNGHASWVAAPQYTRFITDKAVNDFFWDGNGIRFADLNGDGLTDILLSRRMFEDNASSEQSREYVWLNTGNGFVEAPQYKSPVNFYYVHTKTGDTGQRLVDLNGDGRTDLLQAHRGEYGSGANNWLEPRHAWLNTGAGWAQNDVWAQNIPLFTYDSFAGGNCGTNLADINGDGAVDIIQGYRGSIDSGTWQTRSSAWLNQWSFRDLMTAVNNGQGGRYTIEYKPSSAWPNSKMPYAVATVSRLNVSDGLGNVTTTDYSYSGGLYDGITRRFLGFAYVKQTLPCTLAACSYQETWFKQDYGSISKPREVRVSSSAGSLISKTVSTYATNGSTIPYTSLETRREQYTYLGTQYVRTVKDWQYDTYGNMWYEYDYGNTEVPDDEIQTYYWRFPNTTSYITSLIGVISITDATTNLSAQTVYHYDNQAEWNVPPQKGLITQTRRWVDNLSAYTKALTEYDSYGQVSKSYDEEGNVTEFIRGDNFYITETRDPLYSQDSRHKTRTAWNTLCGQVNSSTDANGVVVNTTYDVFCRPKQITDTFGGFKTISYDFDSSGFLSVRTESNPADGRSNQWRVDSFDGLGRKIKTESKGPDYTTIIEYTAYNAAGLVARKSDPYYNNEGTRWTSYTYDALNRLVSTTLADGTTSSVQYGLLETTTTDARGAKSKTVVDARGRVLKSLELLDGVWQGASYKYSNAGRHVEAFDQDNNKSVTEYDSLGRRISVNDPDLGVWGYMYTVRSQLLEQTDAKGQKTRFTYDALGRMLTKTSLYGTASLEVFTWRYDEARAGFYNVGQKTSERDSTGRSGSADFDYDQRGNLSKRSRTIDGVTYAFQYTYDALGRLATLTYPDGDVLYGPSRYDYDGAGRIEVLPGFASGITYTATGQILKRTNANGTNVSIDYWPATQLVKNITATASTWAVIHKLDYNYFPNGLTQTVTSPIAEQNWSFDYDSINRLKSASSGATSYSYSYTATGNILSNGEIGGANYTYPPAGSPRPHAVTSVGGSTYSYDANGNLLSGGGRTITWDADNRPFSVNGNAYRYDINGERIKKVENGIVTLFLGDDCEVSGGVYTKYIRLGGEVIAKRVGKAVAEWLYTDALGSVSASQSTSGAVQYFAYKPYGSPRTVGSSGVSRLGFTGEMRDDTGLIYLGARYYDPVLGRFLSPDTVVPTDAPAGLNRYTYAFNTPTMYVDPTGHVPWAHIFSGLRAGFGIYYMVLGSAMCSTGVGCIAGSIFIAYGANETLAGGQTMLTGKVGPTLFEQALSQGAQGLGMPEADADRLAGGVYAGTSLAIGASAGSYADKMWFGGALSEQQYINVSMGGGSGGGLAPAAAGAAAGCGGLCISATASIGARVPVGSLAQQIGGAVGLIGPATGQMQMNGGGRNVSSASQMDTEVKKQQAPRGVNRVDRGLGPYEKDHVHFGSGEKSPALNNDGTWKHNPGQIPNSIKKWLKKHGWQLPEE